MMHEVQPIETSRINLPQSDAQKVTEHLIGMGFTFCPGAISCHGPSETYEIDILEDPEGRMVAVERHQDHTTIEAGADLALYLSNLGLYS